MPLYVLLALAATTATPTMTPVAAAATTEAAAPSTKKRDVDPMQAMGAVMKVFDKFFPAGPEPDPVRLVAARQATMTMFPKGAYSEAVTTFLNRTADRVLDMSEADFVAMFPEGFDDDETGKNGKKGKKAKKAKKGPPSTEPLRLMLAKKDPTFDAKQAAIRAFAGAMIVKFADVAEPKFREGMARSLARKFDSRQLAEIQGFLATPTGAAYGREMVGLWFQPEVMRSTFDAFPELMKMMPDLAKDGQAFESQMKSLDEPADGKSSD